MVVPLRTNFCLFSLCNLKQVSVSASVGIQGPSCRTAGTWKLWGSILRPRVGWFGAETEETNALRLPLVSISRCYCWIFFSNFQVPACSHTLWHHVSFLCCIITVNCGHSYTDRAGTASPSVLATSCSASNAVWGPPAWNRAEWIEGWRCKAKRHLLSCWELSDAAAWLEQHIIRLLLSRRTVGDCTISWNYKTIIVNSAWLNEPLCLNLEFI